MDHEERLKAALADRYQIEREVGSGGMATVYLAQDLKHERQVAVKVLKPELAAVLGGERFLSEIRVTANLQHPHILPLHDSGDADGFLFFVMPFVEGESLRAKLDREKQLAVEKAVKIAGSVGSALDYAHRQGVVHRDIKPANILLQDGQPMVADFGIALAVRAAGGERLTETGLSLGTPQYMSPEQAYGDREVDGRSDVYSLAAVLYEMLAGEPPHTGTTLQAILSKVLTDPVRPIGELRASTPGHVRFALEKGLAKLPADRCPSASEFMNLLSRSSPVEAAEVARSWTGPTPRPGPAPRWWLLAALLAWATAATVLGIRLGSASSEDVAISRWQFTLPDGAWLARSWGWWDHPVAVSSDGRSIAYGARNADGLRLFVRHIEELRVREVPGSEGGANPFFSPDGRWLGFFAQAKLKKVSLEGGSPVEIVDVPGVALGASWGKNDTILYAEGDRGLLRVPATGGSPELVRPFEPGSWIASPAWVEGLSTALVTIRTGQGPRVGAVDMDSGELRVFEELGTAAGAHYSARGFLLFGQGNALRVVPFDAKRLRITGPSVVLRDSVAFSDGHPLYAASGGGTVAYVPPSRDDRRLVWVDRQGQSSALSERSGGFFRPRLSPDGDRVLANLTDPDAGTDLWVLDLERGSFRPLLPGTPSGIMSDAVWTPDGSRVTCYRFVTSGDSAIVDVADVPADGMGAVETLISREDYFPHSWSPDGRVLAFYVLSPDPGMRRDIWTLNRSGELRVLFATRANERSPSFSPDGRWLAYVSDESGWDEVYVVAYPSLTGKTQVSRDGGRVPEWSRDSRELFYRNGSAMLSVQVETGQTFQHEEPKVLFEGDYWTEPIVTGSHDYDVSLDGQRFLMISTSRQTQFNVVLNWSQELQERLQDPGRGGG
jgi:serine/threonine-protein kinase